METDAFHTEVLHCLRGINRQLDCLIAHNKEVYDYVRSRDEATNKRLEEEFALNREQVEIYRKRAAAEDAAKQEQRLEEDSNRWTRVVYTLQQVRDACPDERDEWGRIIESVIRMRVKRAEPDGEPRGQKRPCGKWGCEMGSLCGQVWCDQHLEARIK